MSRTIIRLSLAILAASALALGGCASSANKAAARAQAARHQEDAAFAAGTRRPPTAETSFSLAKILVAQGRDRDAIYVLERVIRDHPTFVPAYNEIAGIYVRADRIDDATTVLTAGLKRAAANDPILLNNLGMCHLLKSEPSAALDAFNAAATRAPSNPVYRANRAAALTLLGRYTEAKSEYQSVVDGPTARRNMEALVNARGKSGTAAAPAPSPKTLAAKVP